MPAPKTYTQAQWNEFARLLDALPEKSPTERRVTARDAMPKIRPHIDKARSKGYSLAQLLEQARNTGIDITENALRYTMQQTSKRGSNKQQAKGVAGKSAVRSLKQPPLNGNASGSKIHRDEYSFEIQPDTENL